MSSSVPHLLFYSLKLPPTNLFWACISPHWFLSPSPPTPSFMSEYPSPGKLFIDVWTSYIGLNATSFLWPREIFSRRWFFRRFADLLREFHLLYDSSSFILHSLKFRFPIFPNRFFVDYRAIKRHLQYVPSESSVNEEVRASRGLFRLTHGRCHLLSHLKHNTLRLFR